MISSRISAASLAKRVRVQRPQVLRQLKLIDQSLRPCRSCPGLLDSRRPGQTPKHPVDQGSGFVGAEALGGPDRLVDDNGGRDFGFPQELVGRKAEYGSLEHAEPLEAPSLDMLPEQVVDLRVVLAHAAHESSGVLVDLPVPRPRKRTLGVSASRSC